MDYHHFYPDWIRYQLVGTLPGIPTDGGGTGYYLGALVSPTPLVNPKQFRLLFRSE